MSDAPRSRGTEEHGKSPAPAPDAAAALVQRSAAARVLYYPDALKRHYLEILRRYRDELTKQRGKPVGWQSIRDLIMEPEDRAVTASMAKSRVSNKSTRVRSTLITLDNMKSWMEDSILPSDVKFQYIERFVRTLRVRGQIDDIERDLDLAQTEYIRDAISLFYRPNPVPAALPRELQAEVLEAARAVLSNACFDVPGQLIEVAQAAKGRKFLMLLHDYHQHVVPLDIVLTRPIASANGPDDLDVIPVYTGFFVAETIEPPFTLDRQAAVTGKLLLTRPAGATSGDDGQRSMSSGGTFAAMIVATMTDLQLSLATGDELRLLADLFDGSQAYGGASARLQPAPFKRILDDASTTSLRARLAFRYRPWM